MTQRISADICVIGAGSAGLSVAAGAAQLGRKVALVEKGEMGGDCLNYGCVPSKALIAAAARAAAIKDGARFGVHGEGRVDFSAVIDHVRGVIAAIEPNDSQRRFEGLGVTVIRAPGSFTGPRTLVAGDVEIDAKHFVVATGSSPVVPDIAGLSAVPYFTNETIFDNRTLPEHLIIVGGGPIGCELAQAFARLGSKVSVIEKTSILNREDPDTVDILRKRFREEGVALFEGAEVKRIGGDAGRIEVHLDGAAAPVRGSHLLVAIGRRVNVDGLGLNKAGVSANAKGVEVDARLRTSNKRIYAIGDVAGGKQFTHVAGDHASTVIRNILFKMPSKRRDDLAPRVTYTSPEVASLGMLPDAALKEVAGARFARWNLAENDRAHAERSTDGFIKVATDRKGRILGVTVVAENAGDLIHPWALAYANGLPIRAFTNYIAPYPTLGEISKRAAGAWYTPTLFSDRTRALVRLLGLFD